MLYHSNYSEKKNQQILWEKPRQAKQSKPTLSEDFGLFTEI